MRRPELLIPASSLEVLKIAVIYGADAVYIGGEAFGLRAKAKNFSMEEMKEGIEFAHAHDVKVYVTANILAHNDDLEGVREYFKELREIKPDALIIADPGVFQIAKEVCPEIERHVSTQANNTNYATYLFWYGLGAKRVVSARELSIAEIKEIREHIPDDLEIETFIHGAMCISYSGRCLLSNYFVGRDSNTGACAQPCRWNYALYSKNEQNPIDEYYPVEEDEHGTYILNSKDMCLIEHIKELAEAGIVSFKIEGRMKSAYYVATVVNAYRRAIDNYLRNLEPNFDYITELQKTSNRSFTTGFYFVSDQKTNKDSSLLAQTHDYVGIVIEDAKNGYALVEHRNKFVQGDELEVLSPNETFNKKILLTEIKDENGEPLTEVKKVKQRVYIKTDLDLKKNDILRKRNNRTL
mgnify:CR=1 FL=1